MVETTSTYASIVKTDKQPDGTLKVYGKATDDSLDIDKQICDNDWLKEAMPQWFTTGGNIREQHSSIAAGVATDYEEKADGHYITALVVDPVSVKKVETGVLKGFSIGIRGPQVMRSEKAPGGIITGGQIVEVSLVDRPANPNAKMTIAKAAENGELMAVEQLTIPSPAELFGKSADEEAPIVTEEVAVEEAVTEEAPAEEAAVEEIAPESEILEAAKSLIATLNKFDQSAFDAAIGAIADLISVEAQEMKEGHDERDSIKELLRAAKHLARWYAGEVAEGEVAGESPIAEVVAEVLELSADAKCEKCDSLEKECKCADKCACEGDCECAADKFATGEITVEEIVAKAVSAAQKAVTADIETLKAANADKEGEVAQLKADLEVALSKAAAGGPVRTATKSADQRVSDLRLKAEAYLAKSAVTTDRVLADGYRQLAAELTAKAEKEGN